jgi:hypothetical protein
MTRAWNLSLLLAVGVAMAGCGGKTAAPAAAESEPGADAITKTNEEGPVKTTVVVWPGKPVLGDSIHLRLTVEARPGTQVEMPAFGEALGRFSIVGFKPASRRGADGGMVSVQSYTLQAPLSGKQRIPPLRVEWTGPAAATNQQGGKLESAAAAGAAAAPTGSTAPAAATAAPATPATAATETHELLTDEVALDISSALPEGSLALRPARGSLDPSPDGPPLAAWIGGAAALAALIGGGLAFRSWRKRAAVRVRISAYDVAMHRLAALESSGIPDDAAADAWYVELSAIVRRYLEDRYAVRAPELTTEEFLAEARRSPELSAQHRELLSSFLEVCDRVKFAGYRPDEAESRQALTGARAFVEDTRLLAEPVPRAQVAVAGVGGAP